MFAFAGIMTVMIGAIGTSSAQENQTSAGTMGTDNKTSAGTMGTDNQTSAGTMGTDNQTSGNKTGFMDQLLKMFGMGGNK